MAEPTSSYGASPAIHPDDLIYKFLFDHRGVREKAAEYYFQDGRKSAYQLRDLLERSTAVAPDGEFEMLEFASGYGCVTRHLRDALPNAKITACDIHDQALTFISREIGVAVVPSSRDPKAFHLGRQFDVVFALSFFSHMPDGTFGDWLEALFRHVRVGGSLIFTTHGNVSVRLLYQNTIKLSSDGYWFSRSSEQHDLKKSDYGTAMTSPEYVTQQIFRRLPGNLAYFSQGSWWGHQDAYVVAKQDRRLSPPTFREWLRSLRGRAIARIFRLYSWLIIRRPFAFLKRIRRWRIFDRRSRPE